MPEYLRPFPRFFIHSEYKKRGTNPKSAMENATIETSISSLEIQNNPR